jgi:hypothetical protein
MVNLQIQHHTFLTTALDGSEVCVPDFLFLRKEPPVTISKIN